MSMGMYCYNILCYVMLRYVMLRYVMYVFVCAHTSPRELIRHLKDTVAVVKQLSDMALHFLTCCVCVYVRESELWRPPDARPVWFESSGAQQVLSCDRVTTCSSFSPHSLCYRSINHLITAMHLLASEHTPQVYLLRHYLYFIDWWLHSCQSRYHHHIQWKKTLLALFV